MPVDHGTQSDFRQWLSLEELAAKDMRETDTAVAHTEKQLANSPFLVAKFERLKEAAREPFRGVTTNGEVIPDLYGVQDDGFDPEAAAAAAARVLEQCGPDEREAVLLPLGAPERRAWFNPELYLFRFGLRLDEARPPLRAAVLALLRATLSPEGYAKALGAMRLNHFLGRLCRLPLVLNRHSYNFALFGRPSAPAATPAAAVPWGWLLSGHHLCLSALVCGPHVVISPTFTGAEPNVIDEDLDEDEDENDDDDDDDDRPSLRRGPEGASPPLLAPEQDLGLALMRGLPAGPRRQAQVFRTMGPPEIPASRWDPADGRHLCGAFQDNRVVPPEGLCLAGLLDGADGEDGEGGGGASAASVELVLRIVEQFHLYLPAGARRNRLDQVRRHIRDTYFCWIGGYGEGDAFYYRIQSPVVICEFDHHAGIFLTNREPARFHIHTITRMPNGGDYGYAVLKQLEQTR